MKAFITGGTGFIGSHLVDFLALKGFEVFVLVRDLRKVKFTLRPNIHLLKGDLFSIPPLPSDLEYLFHLAGLTKALKKEDYYTVNQLGTASLFQKVTSQKIRPKIILLSSLAACGPSLNGRGIRETEPPRPVNPYGVSKLKSEEEALKYKDFFSLAIVRVGPVFGPGDKDFLPYFKWIKKGILPVFDSSEMLLSFCYVKDLVRALFLCSQLSILSGEIFHIADPRPYRWDEFGEKAGQVMGKPLKKIRIPYPFVYLAALLSELNSKLSQNPSNITRAKLVEMKHKYWIADTHKAREKLSFQTEYSLEEALKETIDWYAHNGWL